MLGFVRGILSDNGHVKRNTIIQIIIATVAFIMLMRVYPFSVIESHKTSKQQAFNTGELKALSGEGFTYADKKLQTVYFTNTHLYSIKLYMTAKVPNFVSGAQRITFRVYDEGFSCISSEEISLFKIAQNGYALATPDIDVEVGKAYYYEILVPEDCETYIELPVSTVEALNQPENSVLFINGIINFDTALVADYDYSSPITVLGMVFRYVLIASAAIILYIAIIYLLGLYDEKFSDNNENLKKLAKIIFSAILVLFGIFVIIYSVILNKFESPVLDRGVYFLAVLVGVLWAMGAMWLPRSYPKARKEYTRLMMWKGYIQSVSFGLLFYALCQYVNAEREFYHQTNTRWMLIFLAIAFLMLLNIRLIINRYSLSWFVLSWAGSLIYCNGFKGDEDNYLLARLTCGVIISWGFLIINIILGLDKENIKYRLSFKSIKDKVQKNKKQAAYMALWVLFALLMYRYRFEKVWVFTATLPFLSLMFIKFTPQLKSRLLKNLTNGIILSFLLVTLFSLIHRPHHYWMLYRYGGLFHTVACTGMYLSVVFAAVLGRIYGHLKDRRSMFLRCYYEYFLIGCVMGFIILTMSRTAFLTIAVCTLFVSALAAYIYKKKLGRILKEFGILAASALVCFPLVFTLVRTVPAVINEPVRYDVEFDDESFMICVGEPAYSDKYITVERFFMLLFGRFENGTEEAADLRLPDVNGQLLAFNSNLLDNVLVSQYTDTDSENESDSGDISNGRFDTFLAYIRAISLSGHPLMGVTGDYGEEYSHAHNSYLQVFYNFGIIAGVVFLLLCAVALLKSIYLAQKQGRKYSIYFVPFALVTAFCFISLTEWAFHPCIPAGFAFLLMQAVLMKD